MSQPTRSSLALVVGLVGVAAASHASAQISITAANVDVAALGSVGKQGSSTGPLQDDPAQLNGTSGVLTLSAGIAGGPVAPGDLPTLPGTTAQVRANGTVRQEFVGGGTWLRVVQQAGVSNAFIDMDNCVGSAGANSVARSTFTLTAATPYTLSGIAAFDNEDVSGSVRLSTALGLAVRSVFVGQNGPFSFSGTLNPGTYTFNSNCNVLAVVGSQGVGPTGFFTESGSFDATLVLGTPPLACDSIDFNGDGLFPDDSDLVDFLSVLAGGACSTQTCNDIDFNNDSLFPDDSDLLAFLRVLAGGDCE
jgi:hypothetical protein